MIGSKIEPSSGISKLPALISTPAASMKSGERTAIKRAGLKTSQACFSVVAPA